MDPPTDDELRAEFLYFNDPFLLPARTITVVAAVVALAVTWVLFEEDDPFLLWLSVGLAVACGVGSAWSRRMAQSRDREWLVRFLRRYLPWNRWLAWIMLAFVTIGLALPPLLVAYRVAIGWPFLIEPGDAKFVVPLNIALLSFVYFRWVVFPRSQAFLERLDPHRDAL